MSFYSRERVLDDCSPQEIKDSQSKEPIVNKESQKDSRIKIQELCWQRLAHQECLISFWKLVLFDVYPSAQSSFGRIEEFGPEKLYITSITNTVTDAFIREGMDLTYTVHKVFIEDLDEKVYSCSQHVHMTMTICCW